MKKILSFAAILLVLTSAFTCGKEENNSDEINKEFINATWKVKAESISGELQNIASIPDGAIYADISLVIPNSTKGNITGNTFYNSIYAYFEIKENQQIILKNYGGTRLAEDKWGMSFGDNLRNAVKFDFLNEELRFFDTQNNVIIIFTNK
jgi:hypothetical protein